ncbi:F-box domain-containing protein [Artemisia annua]|uniref:F-box domain-containing protein n=1 Tax=Artemisia annua TaxID=35608 RepID=A0A2U1KB00_ARTAN|nr:F-box domain-containing protein [Artemisia annua]
MIYIWNPSLSALSPLPPSRIHSSFDNKHLRFGFDPKTDDYKAVKVISFQLPNRRDWLQVAVFSMRKCLWKLITERFPSHISICSNQDELYFVKSFKYMARQGPRQKLGTKIVHYIDSLVGVAPSNSASAVTTSVDFKSENND